MAGERKEAQGRDTATVIPFARSMGADPADPFGMSEWMKSMTQMPLNPLMTHPAAAVAAATALGFGLSSHIAGMMFGAMQGAASAFQGGARGREPMHAAEPGAAAPAEPTQERTTTSVITSPEPAKAPPVPATAPKLPAEAKASPAAAVPAAARKPKAPKKQATPAAKSRAGDDLKRISGLGPKLEQVLNGKGIRRLADIAALSAEDAARLDAEIGLDGRIARDDWVGQAKALMQGK